MQEPEILNFCSSYKTSFFIANTSAGFTQNNVLDYDVTSCAQQFYIDFVIDRVV